MMDISDIVAAWFMVLCRIQQISVSSDTHQVFYLDETWVNQNHSLKMQSQDFKCNGGLKDPVGKGGWLIVCHPSKIQP
jgi:hypothetical protein